MWQVTVTPTQTGLLASLEHLGCKSPVATHESMVPFLHLDVRWIRERMEEHNRQVHE